MKFYLLNENNIVLCKYNFCITKRRQNTLFYLFLMSMCNFSCLFTVITFSFKKCLSNVYVNCLCLTELRGFCLTFEYIVCLHYRRSVNAMSDSFEFWLVGVLCPMVTMLGIIGNIICIIIFKYKKLNMNQTFASLLKWLAVIDSFFLVSIV